MAAATTSTMTTATKAAVDAAAIPAITVVLGITSPIVTAMSVVWGPGVSAGILPHLRSRA